MKTTNEKRVCKNKGCNNPLKENQKTFCSKKCSVDYLKGGVKPEEVKTTSIETSKDIEVKNKLTPDKKSKVCSTCKEVKDLNKDFYNSKSSKDGKGNVCKSCSNERVKEYQRNKKKKSKVKSKVTVSTTKVRNNKFLLTRQDFETLLKIRYEGLETLQEIEKDLGTELKPQTKINIISKLNKDVEQLSDTKLLNLVF